MTLVCHMCKVQNSESTAEFRAITTVNSSLLVVQMMGTSQSQNVFSPRGTRTLISWYGSLHLNIDIRNGMTQNVMVLLLLCAMFRRIKLLSLASSRQKLPNRPRKENSWRECERQQNTLTLINCASQDNVDSQVVSIGIRSVMKIRTRKSNC